MNVNDTVNVIRGAVLNPQPTWTDYLARGRDWKETLVALTLPLVVASILVEFVIALVFEKDIGLVFLFNQAIFAAITVAVFTLALAGLASSFGGTTNFDRALAAITLSGAPLFLAKAMYFVPVIGPLIYFAGGIYSLILLYQIIPLYVGIPEEKRILHFIVTVVAGLIISAFLFMFLQQNNYLDN